METIYRQAGRAQGDSVNPYVTGIYYARRAGEMMVSVDQAEAKVNRGLVGDRYYEQTGFWQNVKKPREVVRDVTLIAQRSIERVRQETGVDFRPEITRRNLLIAGDVELMELLGQMFVVGGVKMMGVEECTPCNRPSSLSGIKGFERAFRDDGLAGIRAQVLTNGRISLGDRLILINEY